jgi:DNA-binding CsgD family transcriptional regulator
MAFIIPGRFFIIPLSVFIFITVIYIYMKKRRNNIKNELLKKENANNKSRKKQDLLKDSIIQRFEISKQIMVMNSSPIQNPKEKNVLTKINEIFYGQSDTNISEEEFYSLLNAVHGNFLIKLSKIFPELNEDEIRICCLMKAGFDTSNICSILNYVPITVRTKKTKIRKKIGITGGGDIIVFLENILEKPNKKIIHKIFKRKRSFFYRFFKRRFKLFRKLLISNFSWHDFCEIPK